MMLIKGEYFNTGSNLFEHVKIQGDILIKDENILIYIEKEGE